MCTVPESRSTWTGRSASSGADLVFLDLEDACAPSAKEGARKIAVGALTGLDWGRTVRAVRVNGVGTPWCHDDVIEVVTGARDALDVLIVPKARTARDVWWFDELLSQLETKLGMRKRMQHPCTQRQQHRACRHEATPHVHSPCRSQAVPPATTPPRPA